MPAPVLIAHFCHLYPGAYESPRYPTRDHVIPFTRFWLMVRATPALLARSRINDTRAIVHALSLTFAAKGSGQSPITRSEMREAYLDTGA